MVLYFMEGKMKKEVILKKVFVVAWCCMFFGVLFYKNDMIVNASSGEIVESGKLRLGNINWEYDSNGVLTFSGEGSLGLGYDDKKNYPVLDKAKKIIVKKGITSLGDEAVLGGPNCESIELPDGLLRMGMASIGAGKIT